MILWLFNKKYDTSFDIIQYFCPLMKKIIAFSFILIAGIIMLAHDIVPHHHHETDAMEQSQSNSSHAEKDHHRSFPEHEHLYGDYLLMVRQALSPAPNISRFLDNDDFTGYSILDYFFIHTPIFHYVYTPPDYNFPIWENTHCSQTSVTYTFGLRAPPVA